MSGIIRFDTEPSGAKIFIDNKYIGDSPLDISDVLPNNYTYRLLLDGYKFENDVYVYDNKISHINVDLTTNNERKEYIDISQEESQEEENKRQLPEPEESDKSTEKSPTSTKKSEHEILEEHLEVMNKILDKNNSLMTDVRDTLEILRQYFAESLGYDISRTYLSSSLQAISVATQTRPENPDIIADSTTTPATPGYDRVLIQKILDRNAPVVTVSNEGTSNLFVIVSHDGTSWSTSEALILKGEYRRFTNVNELRIRSPVAGGIPESFGAPVITIATAVTGLPTGGVYRISEYTTEHYTRNINRTSFFSWTIPNLPLSGGAVSVFGVSTDILIFNLSVAVRASPTNTENIFLSSEELFISPDFKATLAPGDTVRLYVTDGTNFYITGNSDTQSIEIIYEQDLLI